jgi:hypothetical protein
MNELKKTAARPVLSHIKFNDDERPKIIVSSFRCDDINIAGCASRLCDD